VYEHGTQDPVKTAAEGVQNAIASGCDTVIVDTAGRLHVDEQLMEELERMKAAVTPQEILLVVDAMTGQDAVNVAKNFNDRLSVDGVIVTKLDGDTRGGAALSVKAITGKPIKFAGIGEKITEIEAFHPERMASRILGMGDVLTLIEKAEALYDEKQAQDMEKKLREASFTLEDFLDQFQQMRNMGGMEQILSMLPGGGAIKPEDIDEKQIKRMEAIIQSMTPQERRRPEILNASRRKRIAAGCGQQVQDVNRLLKQYDAVKKMLKQFSGKNMKRMARRGMRGKFPGGFPF